MGIFDFLRKSSPPPAGGAPVDKKVAGYAKVAADKRAQTYDRMEALQALTAMKSVEAAAALLKRFTFSIDPSITDQDEKEMAFQGVVDAGKDVIPALREFCARAETLSWPLKIFRALLEDEEYREELLDLLERFDTEYARNVEPKQQVIVALGELRGDDVREGVERFLEDVNETVRFHAVQTTFAQGSEESVPALVKMLAAEESVRIKNKVAEGLMARRWAIPEELRADAQQALRDSAGYGVGADGRISKGPSFG
ncbi:MAG TPA: HEAT repeat domain-containing protein [Candidatus Nanopelagicales bacterium]|nr:HEAT repeat domain-containing protein [Candidatus Nanopelagicales bacterium]